MFSSVRVTMFTGSYIRSAQIVSLVYGAIVRNLTFGFACTIIRCKSGKVQDLTFTTSWGNRFQSIAPCRLWAISKRSKFVYFGHKQNKGFKVQLSSQSKIIAEISKSGSFHSVAATQPPQGSLSYKFRAHQVHL